LVEYDHGAAYGRLIYLNCYFFYHTAESNGYHALFPSG